MNWTITYYSDSVQKEILAMSAGFLGRYLRYADRMEIYGPDMGMPHTRAMGEGLFELRIKAAEGIARVLYHGGQSPDRHAPSLREEERQDTKARGGDGPTTNEGIPRCLVH